MLAGQHLTQLSTAFEPFFQPFLNFNRGTQIFSFAFSNKNEENFQGEAIVGREKWEDRERKCWKTSRVSHVHTIVGDSICFERDPNINWDGCGKIFSLHEKKSDLMIVVIVITRGKFRVLPDELDYLLFSRPFACLRAVRLCWEEFFSTIVSLIFFYFLSKSLNFLRFCENFEESKSNLIHNFLFHFSFKSIFHIL